ncbi:MAG: tetratricopeptide repeat protein [Polyangiales bacterium]
MIKVSCPSCNASYDVDEHRLPSNGLRMRCPKCSESFQVHRDGTTAKSGGGAAPGTIKRAQRKPTQVGLGPGAPPPTPAAAIKSPPSNLPTPAGEVDLPAPYAGGEVGDLPVPKRSGRSLDFDPFDDSGVAELPAPKAGASPSGFDPFADMDLPTPYGGPGGTDLPAPLSGSLPTEIDLPVPRGPSRAREIEAAGEEIDLPMALSDAELPTPKTASSIPAPIALDSDLPMPRSQQDLPIAREDFMDLDFDGPERVHGGGPIELDLPDGDDLDLEMDLDMPARPPGAPPPLDQAFGAATVERSSDRPGPESAEPEELEFSELPREGDDGVHRMPRPSGPAFDPVAASKRKIEVRATAIKRPPWLMKALIALAAIISVLGAGFYLGRTEYGLFGLHLLEPFLPAAGDEVLVAQAIEKAELVASSDTYADTRRALADLEQARGDASLNRSLVARTLLHESYYQARYGQDAESASIADELRLHLQRRGDHAPRVHVALAADALRNADLTTAASEIALAAQDDPTDVYTDLVAGEVALKRRDGKAAVQAFERALKKDESARAEWGLARAYRMLGESDKAAAASGATQKLSPQHAGARIALADLLIANGEIDQAFALLQAPAGLEPIEGSTLQVARADKSAALARVAQIEERRGRMGAARELYEKAIELDSSNADAALGAARLVLLEGGYSDAYARFQTVLGSDIRPGAEMHVTGKPRVLVEAKLGAAEALLAMDKAQDAWKVLDDLQTPEPVSAEVELWLGKVAEGLGDTQEAVTHFRNAIRLEPKSFRAYIALAQHYTSTKRPGEAVGVLVEAQKNVDITAEVRRLLGWAELQRNRVDDAITQFVAALEMEPRDSSAQFGLAVAYRRKGMLQEASVALAKVQELDAKFPGLPLERGRLAEAGDDMDAAATSYRDALKETPNDAALMSRLGAVLVMTGKLDEAQALLQQVIDAQPYSAEAEHYLGRIELERGHLEPAREHFVRAARLQSENGLFRMYVAWVALEANEMTSALRELDAALKLDPTLGDAYWLRARIRIRAGTVRDALDDLRMAVELNPKRIDAWAAMAECHYQLGQTGEAIAALEKAVAGNPKRGYWWYRLGRLQLDEGRQAQALTSLNTATSLGDEDPEEKGWLADAHRLVGEIYYAEKKRQDAIVQYGRYLELAEPGAIDRADVEAKLRRIGGGSD